MKGEGGSIQKRRVELLFPDGYKTNTTALFER